ncbi:eukaryotic translation initiation factor 3 subunit, putative [Ricinus communis]|uniref:Eukaryotic translation initiation factor 3 subunit H n=1 Tax=Ricinus communis TaxID=3988 RepID=B9SUY5_RICCO|nr:eukaryotic translation initiation factor 3 subunit, putative [Ricinus communis]
MANNSNTVTRSFLQVASTEEVAPPLRVVQIEGLVILKIIKHCKEFSPALVTGQLLGLDVGSVLEVTNCFPFPIREEDEEIEADGANYQLEMMRCLREVNVDNNTVGWYQSTLLGSFQTVELIETFMNYQENISRCVCIIYDPSRSEQGVLALKALKLSDAFMELYRNNNFTGEKLRERNLSWVDIFEEIPIKVSNSALISAFMSELETDSPVTQCDYDRLQLSTNPFLERNVEFLVECMDELSIEQQKLGMVCNMTCKLPSFAVPILLSEPFTAASSAANMASEEKGCWAKLQPVVPDEGFTRQLMLIQAKSVLFGGSSLFENEKFWRERKLYTTDHYQPF